jgi:Type I restriction-modification system methyltransferase subunit
MALSQKHAGAYYTPANVVALLVGWAVQHEGERMLDPSCGDGRFLAGHRNSVGIEQDPLAARTAIANAPSALVHEGDFFAWAAHTSERFECAAGNPPFIRYQTFKGELRELALDYCASVGARFSGLASSWAPFLVATASLLMPGGRMAFVVPAEIGHAPYAIPLVEYLAKSFSTVHVVAVRKKLFPQLSEDCWLLYADGFGGATDSLRFSAYDTLPKGSAPPKRFISVPLSEWRDRWNGRLRPFVLPASVRDLYDDIRRDGRSLALGELARIGIGYVSGANDFFHLRPSEARRLKIPDTFLQASVRNGRALPATRLTAKTVDAWRDADEQVLLLKLPKSGKLPAGVSRYLDSPEAQMARLAFKCRTRDPWFSVPDVQIPDFFLTYMSGENASLVSNDAMCSCTNSVHSVRLYDRKNTALLTEAWDSPFTRLATEIEGHPLGGGMLKLEPREASRVSITSHALTNAQIRDLSEAKETMKAWRHYGTTS